MRILVFDPSGNVTEGKGTSGWALFVDGELKEFDVIAAENFSCAEAYWSQHVALIRVKDPNIVVCESYKLFGHKAKQQSGSAMETPQLIGTIRMQCWSWKIPLVFQNPSDKVRFNDMVLEDTGFIQVSRGPSGKITGYMCQGRRTTMHERDAIRHGLFALKYNKELKKIADSKILRA